MNINLNKISYQFLDAPIVIGGKAMEYYGLRQAGDDIDMIISERDYDALSKLYPENSGKLDMDFFVRLENFEMWKSIRQFGYSFYHVDSTLLDGFRVMSVERLVWLKALYISEQKSIDDLALISKYVMQNQYRKYRKRMSGLQG